jgi:hypothetical protein
MPALTESPPGTHALWHRPAKAKRRVWVRLFVGSEADAAKQFGEWMQTLTGDWFTGLATVDPNSRPDPNSHEQRRVTKR